MKLNYIVIPIVTLAVALLGSYITSNGMSWYETLTLPKIAPPGSLIGIVWTVIFILSTASALILYNSQNHNNLFWWIIGIFILNAVLNVLWSGLFFGLGQIFASIVEMIVLEISVVALIILIWPLSRISSVLLMPYAFWVAFATYLASQIWSLNK